MILDKTTTILINPNNIKHYIKKGYENLKIRDYLEVNICDLPINSRKSIRVKCFNCENTKDINYCDYMKITSNNTTDYYCKECKGIKTKETVLKNYGVENVFQLDEVKEKSKQTSIKKYEVEHHTKTDDFIEKIKKTNLEKYKVEYVQQNEDIRNKTEETNKLKYGFKTSLLNDKVKNKINKTLLEKYGVISPLQNEEIKNKYKKTRFNNIIKKYGDLNILDIKGSLYTILCDEGHSYQIHSSLLYQRKYVHETTICTVCNRIDFKNTSELENKLYDFIKENYNGDIIKNDRNIIGKELDIYLPELKLAFEFNGLYYHSEIYKDKNYHKEKTDLCEDNNIQLIHIWEDDWLYKQDIIKSMILNKLGKINNKVYARKCEIKEIKDNKLIKSFLETNHIQGFVGSNIKLGLFYEDELVSLMTFGKTRKNMNSISDNDYDYEMLRFCNKLNTIVVGGASKLFKYFIRNYKYYTIITYADRGYSNGNLYRQLGFDFIHITSPNYYYVVNKIKEYRFKYRKDILVKEGYDENKTEHEIMLERNIYRIYNSGNYKFKYLK